jgi:hypothetical protein
MQAIKTLAISSIALSFRGQAKQGNILITRGTSSVETGADLVERRGIACP